MTRAGENLYGEPDGPQGSVLWAFVSHPLFLRGAWHTIRLLVMVVLVATLFGLG